MCWQMFGLLVWKLRKLLKQLCATWSRKCPSGAFRKFIKQKKRKDFVFPFKASRRVALSEMDKQNKRFVSAVTASQYARSVSDLPVPTACEGGTAVSSCQRIYLDKVPFALLLIASVVTDHEGKSSVLYLVTSDLTQVFSRRKHRLDASAIRVNGYAISPLAVYKKRWKIEEFHKSIKEQCGVFQVSDEASLDTKQPFFRQPGCVHEDGNAKGEHKPESFRPEVEVVPSRTGHGVGTARPNEHCGCSCPYHKLTA